MFKNHTFMGKFKQVLQHHTNTSNFEYQYIDQCIMIQLNILRMKTNIV